MKSTSNSRNRLRLLSQLRGDKFSTADDCFDCLRAGTQNYAIARNLISLDACTFRFASQHKRLKLTGSGFEKLQTLSLGVRFLKWFFLLLQLIRRWFIINNRPPHERKSKKKNKKSAVIGHDRLKCFYDEIIAYIFFGLTAASANLRVGVLSYIIKRP